MLTRGDVTDTLAILGEAAYEPCRPKPAVREVEAARAKGVFAPPAALPTEVDGAGVPCLPVVGTGPSKEASSALSSARGSSVAAGFLAAPSRDAKDARVDCSAWKRFQSG